MNRGKRIFRSAAALACLLSSATALWLIPLERVSAQTPGDSVIYLDQGWSQADRELYYQTPQGSVVASYDIFTNMEVAGSQELFRSDANSARFGLIPQAANPRTNPDGFPVGVTKNVVTEGRWKGVTVGPNCAVCHTAELMYKGKRIRIDGGHTNLFDIQAYMQALDQAYQATLTDTAKFDRMAARIGATSTDAKSELRTRLGREAARTHYYSGVAAASPFPWGPGRADCLTLISNRLASIEPNIPENMSVAAAPVKIPFVWNAGQATWTQWGGWAQDPLARNFGETLGVYLPMDLQSKTPEEGLFDSAAAILNLQKIEDTMWRLAPPKWPEEIFGKIDRVKAAQGKALFATHCASCHNSYPYTWTAPNKYGKRFLEVGLVPKTYMGTDMQQTVVVNKFMHTAQLSPYLPPPDKGKAVVLASDFKATPRQATARQGSGKTQTERRGYARSEWLSGTSVAAWITDRVEGSTARRSVGHAAFPAQWLGAQPLRDADPGESTHQEVLRRARFRSGQGGSRHQRQLRDVPSGYLAARQFERRPFVRERSARQRYRRPAVDRSATLGTGRILEIDSRRSRPGHAVWWTTRCTQRQSTLGEYQVSAFS